MIWTQKITQKEIDYLITTPKSKIIPLLWEMEMKVFQDLCMHK
jgi:hypothetical protein